jgi:hypothetical protein
MKGIYIYIFFGCLVCNVLICEPLGLLELRNSNSYVALGKVHICPSRILC